MNRLQTYHQKLKKEDFTEVKSSFLVCPDFVIVSPKNLRQRV